MKKYKGKTGKKYLIPLDLSIWLHSLLDIIWECTLWQVKRFISYVTWTNGFGLLFFCVFISSGLPLLTCMNCIINFHFQTMACTSELRNVKTFTCSYHMLIAQDWTPCDKCTLYDIAVSAWRFDVNTLNILHLLEFLPRTVFLCYRSDPRCIQDVSKLFPLLSICFRVAIQLSKCALVLARFFLPFLECGDDRSLSF